MAHHPERSLKLRIKLCSFAALGPGKVELLERIGDRGSISAAARALKMSYRRAWLLVDEMNRAFRTPVIDTQFGGNQGGGARVTPLGHEVIALYREIQRKAEEVVKDEIATMAGLLAEDLEGRVDEAEKLHGRIDQRCDWRDKP